MKYITLLLLFSLATSLAGQIENRTVTFDGVERVYTVKLPSGFSDEESRPLVINMHGFGSNRLQQQFYAGMDPVADANNFIVVYPDGLESSWNVGWDFGSTADDVGFIDTLLDEMILEYNVNPNRIYSTGMSNGGFMSYVLACELGDRITAIASVTGGMVPGSLMDCDPGRTLPIMQIHGTEDGTVPYNGSLIVVPIEEGNAFWANYNNCNPTPTITDVPDINTNDASTAENYLYQDCDGNTTVEFYKITGGGHTWPGAAFNIGVTNQDFNASEEIWRFFSQFQLDGEPTASQEFLTKEDVSVYPNPFDGQLRVEAADIKFISLLSLDGKLLIRQAGDRGNTVATNNLAPGVYVVRVQTSKGVYVERVVKG